MLNEFEIIVWMIWLKLVTFPDEEEKVIDFLQIIALFVKHDNNDAELYDVFETFYSHNYPNFYARFKNWPKPIIHLTSADINKYYKELTRTFEYKQENQLKDYNYEVDALEAEHDKREVHTTTKFEEEKLKKMEEEAKKSNAMLNYGKKHNDKSEIDIKDETSSSSRKRNAKAENKAKEESEKGSSNVTVGNISVKENSGENLIGSKIHPTAFKPPSFKSNAVDQSVGFMPYSIEGKPSSIIPGLINSSGVYGSGKLRESVFKNYGQGEDNRDKGGFLKFTPQLISGASNPNSAEINSFNINMDILNAKQTPKDISDSSFQSMLPEFSKKDSYSLLWKNNKSGSVDARINRGISDIGSFANANIYAQYDNQLNINKHHQENEKQP